MKIKLIWISIFLIGFSAASHSEGKRNRNDPVGTAYKQTLPDGSVIYTDTPNKSVKIEKTIPPEPAVVFSPRQNYTNDSDRRSTEHSPMLNGMNVGSPGTPIPIMPPLPGDSVSRPAPPAPVIRPAPATLKSSTDVATREKLDEEILKAEISLAVAIKRQKEGVASQPGDRNGTASGGSRLNSAYQGRQDELAAAVKNSQAQLDKLTLMRKDL